MHWASKVAEEALQRKIEFLQVKDMLPPDSAFALEKDFVECPSLGELHKQFRPEQGHHDDWD